MSDPAVEAAHRAINARAYSVTCVHAAVLAAREVLKPIREQWELLEAAAVHEDAEVEYGMLHVLKALAPFIYTTEELVRNGWV